MGEQLHERQTALMPFILMDRIGARPSRSAAALRGITPADDQRNRGQADPQGPPRARGRRVAFAPVNRERLMH